jgi:hypothetical protein
VPEAPRLSCCSRPERRAADRAHQHLAAVDVDLGHLHVPVAAVIEQRARELADLAPDQHHPAGDFLADVRIAGGGHGHTVEVGDHHGLQRAALRWQARSCSPRAAVGLLERSLRRSGDVAVVFMQRMVAGAQTRGGKFLARGRLMDVVRARNVAALRPSKTVSRQVRGATIAWSSTSRPAWRCTAAGPTTTTPCYSRCATRSGCWCIRSTGSTAALRGACCSRSIARPPAPSVARSPETATTPPLIDKRYTALTRGSPARAPGARLSRSRSAPGEARGPGGHRAVVSRDHRAVRGRRGRAAHRPAAPDPPPPQAPVVARSSATSTTARASTTGCSAPSTACTGSRCTRIA